MKLIFLTAQSEIESRAMFEDISLKQNRERPPEAETIVVSGTENGGIVISQRGAEVDRGHVVIPPEQAEPLIAAIRRHLNPRK
jgi:hypothetical protein